MNRYEQIISACGFSEEMECYLIGCKVVRILKGESKEDL